MEPNGQVKWKRQPFCAKLFKLGSKQGSYGAKWPSKREMAAILSKAVQVWIKTRIIWSQMAAILSKTVQVWIKTRIKWSQMAE